MCGAGCESQVAGRLTPLHQQCSEALSLSRCTSWLGNVLSLQNKHTSHLLHSLRGFSQVLPLTTSKTFTKKKGGYKFHVAL